MSHKVSPAAASLETTGIPATPDWSQHYEMSLSHDEAAARRGSIGGAFDETRLVLSQIARQCGSTAAMNVYYNHLQEQLQNHTAQQVAELSHIDQLGDSVHSDPVLYTTLTDQLAAVYPLVKYADHEARGHREDLISGAGLFKAIAKVLRTKLRGGPDPLARQNSGMIHELTMMALIDMDEDESPDCVALPGLPYEDERLKRDVMLHIVTSGGFVTIPLQGTNNEADGVKNLTRLPLVVGGCAIGNTWINDRWPTGGGYQTSHAILAAAEGRATDEQMDILWKIRDDLLDTVWAGEPFVNLRLAQLNNYLNGRTEYDEPIAI